MSLNQTQMQTLASALRAETNVNVVAAMSVRNDVFLTQWCNTAGSSDAWNPAMDSKSLFEASDITKFDNLTAGKRDAWRVMLDFAPIDFSRNKMQKAAKDIWGVADSVAVLQACVRKATNGEAYLGGTSATENTVTALKLSVPGNLSLDDISNSLNAY